mgnify:CR=1 FL=1|jgi:biotin carboxyl carrier protein|tara:strand:+ start:70 stop:453 length:384 start_codon:yes stop_codon:yes gene_type:complete
MEDLTINVDGREYHVKIEETEDGKILVHHGKETYEIDAGHSEADIYEVLNKSKSKTSTGTIISPLPGTIYEVKVQKEDKVKEGDVLIKIIAMKMENNITATKTGTIKEIKVKKNDVVNKGDILVIID